MQAELARFRPAAAGLPTGRPLQMRIGINTGPVLLGTVGTTGEYTAMGDTVNVASRLEHAAPLGGILISHDTYRHVQRHVRGAGAGRRSASRARPSRCRSMWCAASRPRTFRVSTRGVEGVETPHDRARGRTGPAAGGAGSGRSGAAACRTWSPWSARPGWANRACCMSLPAGWPGGAPAGRSCSRAHRPADQHPPALCADPHPAGRPLRDSATATGPPWPARSWCGASPLSWGRTGRSKAALHRPPDRLRLRR